MSAHRDSYKKTTLLALGVGVILAVVAGGIILTQALDIPELGTRELLPSWLAWPIGLLFLGAALVCLAVAVGGFMALHYDAKGRAVF